MSEVLARRRAGVLLHPTSLPGPGAVGTLGEDAFRFVDFLRDGGFTVWQTLPLGPADAHGSPYGLQSTYAGDHRLIDSRRLALHAQFPRGTDFDALHEAPLEAYQSFCSSADAAQIRAFAAFMRRDRKWLLPYGLFELCRHRFEGAPWWKWPAEYRHRPSRAVASLLATDAKRFRAIAFRQYVFELLWSSLKHYANARGVFLFGDVPFYLDLNSADIWWEPHLFRLGEDDRPVAVAGVPPDYFNENGQLWGNPLYDWDALERTGFDWWVRRFELQLERFDLLRIDHFRALESFWEVPRDAETAKEGHWHQAPGAALLTALHERLGDVPLVAEDLGLITDEVRELRDRFGLPGMVVLQFAFDGLPDNPHEPSRHRRNAVVYTGTHDNNTVAGWLASVDDDTRERIENMFGHSDQRVPQELVEAAYASAAQLAVVPLQDLMGLGAEARMNTPGTTECNWSWRFRWEDLDSEVAVTARRLAERYERAPVLSLEASSICASPPAEGASPPSFGAVAVPGRRSEPRTSR